MNRRGFLRTLAGGAAAAVAVRTFPFRVYSFPSEPLVNWYDGRLFWFGRDQDVWTLNRDQADAFEQLAVKIENEFYSDSIAGIRYVQAPAAGTYLGLKRAEYPGRLAPNQRTIARGAFTVTDIDDDEMTITVAPSAPQRPKLDIGPAMKQLRGELDAAMQSEGEPLFRAPPGNAIRKKVELALGDTFKEEDLVFRSIADRWRDFRNSLKRA